MSAAKLHRTLAAHLGGTVAANVHTAGVVTGLRYDQSGPSGNVFIGFMPDKPEVSVAIMPSGGRRQATKGAYDLPAFQIMVRHANPSTGLDLAQAIYDELACLDGVTLAEDSPDEIHVHGITPQQSGPIPLGFDSARRHEWSLNFDAMVANDTDLRP